MVVKAKTCKTEKEKANILTDDLVQLEKYVKDFWQFLPVPSCYTTPAFNILEMSQSLEELCDFTAQELTGEGVERLFIDKEAVGDLQEELSSNRAIFSKAIELLTQEGRSVPVSLSAVARQDEEGNIIGYFFAFADTRERKQFESELTERIEELEKFQNLAINRELKMVELKAEIVKLKGLKVGGDNLKIK